MNNNDQHLVFEAYLKKVVLKENALPELKPDDQPQSGDGTKESPYKFPLFIDIKDIISSLNEVIKKQPNAEIYFFWNNNKLILKANKSILDATIIRHPDGREIISDKSVQAFMAAQQRIQAHLK
jgi:hypothetical protein